MKRLLFIVIIVTSFWQSPNGQIINHWETIVHNHDAWRYHVGTIAPDPGWRSLLFDDSSWLQGPGGIGFGDNDDNTEISKCPSVFLRRKFNIIDKSLIASVVISVDYDDAFVAYLNDTEIARSGIAGTYPAFDQFGSDHEASMYRGGQPESFPVNADLLNNCLLQGENVLAVQVHNSSAGSSDLSSSVWFSAGILDDSRSYSSVPDWFVPVGEFTSSNLPIVIIETSQGEPVEDEPKIIAEMKIINNGNGLVNNTNDPGNIYSGSVGIEIRGRYSASLPQKPYGFETRDESGNNLNVAILGMPEENDWVLTANYNDKTFLRNFLAFELFRKMGHYAPRSVYCEVVLNNQYQGIYLLGEKIKQDKNRIDIAELNPDENGGDDLTGGYIFKNDYYMETDSWMSRYSPLNKPGSDVFFVYYDPKPEDLTSSQRKYLKDFVDSFEDILYSPEYTYRSTGYRAYIDVSSFVDYFILGELTRNVDAYKKSRFYFKDKDSRGGKIYSGPPWDFDWAWKDITENCIHFNQTDGSGWAYRVNDCDNWPIPPSWEVRLVQDENFADQIYSRYFSLRETILNETYINHVIDSVALLLSDAQTRHFSKWNILGINVGTPEYGEQPDSYEGEIDKFKNWINRRLAWLDANMIGEETDIPDDDDTIYRIFPNPAGNHIFAESNQFLQKVSIFSLAGIRLIEKTNIGEYKTLMDVSHLKPGLYIIKIHLSTGEVVIRRFIKKQGNSL